VVTVDATSYHAIYGTFDITVFAAYDATVDEVAQQALLVRLEILTLVPADALLAAGFRLNRPVFSATPAAVTCSIPRRATGLLLMGRRAPSPM